MKNLVLLGGGGHAKSVLTIIKKLFAYRIIGYVDPQNRGELLGIPYLGDDTSLFGIASEENLHVAAIGIGNIKLSCIRSRLKHFLNSIGLDCPPIQSPTSIVNEEVIIGDATVVMDAAVINSGVSIGECCIINTRSTVEHDCKVGNNVHIAPGALLNGGVSVGDNTLIGSGATVIQGVSICKNCVIGSGAVVVRNILDPGTYLGVPARKVK